MRPHEPEPEPEKNNSGCLCFRLICSVIAGIFVFVVGLFVLICFIGFFFFPTSERSVSVPDPTITIESTTVKAYTVGSNNSLSYTINLGIRVHNSLVYHSLDFYGNETRVSPESETMIDVEVVAKAEELTVDAAAAAAGEGHMDVFLDGLLGVWHDDVYSGVPGGHFDATCKDVAVDFSLNKDRVQKVDCEVRVVE